MERSAGWVLMVAELVLAAVGVTWLFAPSLPWLGRLPGDIRYEGRNVRLYCPLVTCILLSLLLTGLLWLVRFFPRR